jgi:hypothetical protein
MPIIFSQGQVLMAFSESSCFLLFSFPSNGFLSSGLGTICIVLHENEETQKGKKTMADTGRQIVDSNPASWAEMG